MKGTHRLVKAPLCNIDARITSEIYTQHLGEYTHYRI